MSSHSLRALQSGDAEWIFTACQDPEIHYWTTIPKPYRYEDAEAFVNGAVPEYRIWVVEESSGKPAGLISIHSVNELGEGDLGYWIAPWARGKGATKVAIDLVVKESAKDPNIRSLVAVISDKNFRSQRVAISAGLHRGEVAPRKCPAGCEESSATIYRMTL